jgi:DNA modification methylase
MAKTIQDLEESSRRKMEILAKCQHIPQSIMVHDKNDKAMDLMAEKRSYASCANDGKQTSSMLSKIFDVSGQSCRGEGMALSRFPQNIGRSLIQFYTNENDVVLDPFAGHNSRMELCYKAGRSYYGSDISREFMEANKKLKDMLAKKSSGTLFEEVNTGKNPDIVLNLGDSRKLPWPDEFADFTITSPPYWDLEYYGDEPGQLGNNTYDGFLSGLQDVMRENYRCLKPGAFCIWCVNDFRRDKKFIAYHCDVIRLMTEVGFVQNDIVITDLGSPIRAAFIVQAFETKIIPKRHEYCLIFRSCLRSKKWSKI